MKLQIILFIARVSEKVKANGTSPSTIGASAISPKQTPDLMEGSLFDT